MSDEWDEYADDVYTVDKAVGLGKLAKAVTRGRTKFMRDSTESEMDEIDELSDYISSMFDISTSNGYFMHQWVRDLKRRNSADDLQKFVSLLVVLIGDIWRLIPKLLSVDEFKTCEIFRKCLHELCMAESQCVKELISYQESMHATQGTGK